MNKRNRGIDLALAYASRLLERPLEETPPVQLSGWDVVSILWPLNDIFRPHIHRIKSVPYEARYEPEADDAIEAFAERGAGDAWNGISAGAWRVLLERHIQMLTVAAANEAAGSSVSIIPQGLPDRARLPWIMLFLLHSMSLPWPAEDRAAFELPPGAVPGPLRPQ